MNNSIKTIEFEGQLFRADREPYNPMPMGNGFMTRGPPNYMASDAYSGADIKYFTLNERELSAYIKENMPYVKVWSTVRPLLLVDILDKPTREHLAILLKAKSNAYKKSLDIAFPIKGNKVSRISESDTAEEDYNMLKGLCKLGFDGYYMRTLKKERGDPDSFHSEVGLCASGLNKLRIERAYKNRTAVPKAPNRKTRRNRNSHNNTRKNNSGQTKKVRLARFLFENNTPTGRMLNF
jgi:hypothetical protein